MRAQKSEAFPAFSRPLAGSWTGNGTAKTQTGTHTGRRHQGGGFPAATPAPARSSHSAQCSRTRGNRVRDARHRPPAHGTHHGRGERRRSGRGASSPDTETPAAPPLTPEGRGGPHSVSASGQCPAQGGQGATSSCSVRVRRCPRATEPQRPRWKQRAGAGCLGPAQPRPDSGLPRAPPATLTSASHWS